MPYYEEILGFKIAWRTSNGAMAAVASGSIEILLLIAWRGEGPPPVQSAYVYVEDPDALFTEYQQSGATIVEPLESRPSGMRDFTITDLDGHRFTLGRGEERLREVAGDYGLSADEIILNPERLGHRT